MAEEWFDAYARGLEALRQRQGAKAAQLLERAIKLRAEPGTNLITYGTNRVDKYTPYIHLASAYLLAGEPDKAQEALRRSEARGREPAEERAKVAALVEEALATSRAMKMPPTSIAAATPTTVVVAPPVTVPVPPTLAAPPSTAAPSPGAAVGAPPAGSVTGALELKTDPPGATALINGRLVGATPLRVDLAPGVYPVTLRKEGTADLSFTVGVEAGHTKTETRTLVATTVETIATPAPVAQPALASLLITSQPAGASVYFDDEPIGLTDPQTGRLVKSGVAPGSHRIRLSLPNHEDVVQNVDVAQTGPTTVTATLPVGPRRRGPGGWLVGVIGAVALTTLGLILWRWRRSAPRPAAVTGREPVTLPQRGRKTAAGVVSALTDDTSELETRAIHVPTRVSAANDSFGEYRLVEQLGRGGMAAVFKAERGGEVCALKRPLTALLEDPEFLERFLREAEIGRTLHHPNIIRIFERGDVDGVPYFTMELVGGETLQSHVRRNGAMAPRAAARVIAQVAEALDYAHLKGVIHRDLKPSNIMILEDGTVKVMDYGIARARRFSGLTLTGAFLGTPDYVAPETAEGKGTDSRSDLYALGVVFYEILTGTKPFVAETPFATLKKHCTEPPTPPSAISPGIPDEIEAIILKLLSKDPDERYPSAEELLIELRGFLNRAA